MTHDRVGLYLRISKDRKGDEAGVDRQRKECTEMIDREKGWEIVGEYLDNDISATDGSERTQWARLLADVRAGKVTRVVAWARDRLSRNPLDAAHLEMAAQDMGVLITIHPGTTYDLTEPAEMLNFKILGSVGGFEGDLRNKRILSANADRRADGHADKRFRLFGYVPNPAKVGTKDNPYDCIVLHDAEAEAIRGLFQKVLAGVTSYRELARWMNTQGVPTTKGNPWTYDTLKNILAQPVYAGIASKVLYAPGYKSKKIRELYRDVVPQWTPIVSREDWDEVQEKLKHKRMSYATGTRGARKTWLSGVMKCEECKTPLYQKREQMACSSKGSHTVSINSDTAMPCVEDYVIRTIAIEGPRLGLSDPEAGRVQEIRDKLGKLERALEAVKGYDDVTDRVRETNALKGERRDLHEELTRLNSGRGLEAVIASLVPMGSGGQISMAQGAENLVTVRAAWEALEMEQKNQIAKALGVYVVSPSDKATRFLGAKRISIYPRDPRTGEVSTVAIDEDPELLKFMGPVVNTLETSGSVSLKENPRDPEELAPERVGDGSFLNPLILER